MKTIRNISLFHCILSMFAALLFVVFTSPVFAGDYQALKGVQKLKTVFDVSMASPAAAPVVFWAVKNVYEDDSVRALPEKPEVAVVFHGRAVNLITTSREGLSEKESKALDTFADMLREMKKDGVKLEVCMYAVKVLGVDPATILPEIDQVGNGFIAVAGYQAQGYSVIGLR